MTGLHLFAQGPHIDVTTLDDPDLRAVANVLNRCVGEARAIQVSHMDLLTGIGMRECQRIVRRLITEYGAPIGTSMRPPFGWYLTETPEELARVVELHRSRALSELTTMARLEKTGLRAVLARIQTELPMEAA